MALAGAGHVDGGAFVEPTALPSPLLGVLLMWSGCVSGVLAGL